MDKSSISDRISAVRTVIDAFRYGSACCMFDGETRGKVTVRFGKGAYTDGRTINMPSSFITEESWDRTLTLGILTHELGHCAFSALGNRYPLVAELREKALSRIRLVADYLRVPEKAEEIFLFMNNVWEDARVNNLSRFGFRNGLLMTLYSDNELARRALQKAGSDEAFTASALKVPLVRNVGLYILSRFDMAMYGTEFSDRLTSVAGEKRLLAEVLMQQMTRKEYASLGLCALIRKMMDWCTNVSGVYQAESGAVLTVELAEELTGKLLCVLAHRQKNSGSSDSDAQSSPSAGMGFRTRIEEFLEKEAEKSAALEDAEISVTSSPSDYTEDSSSALKVSDSTAVLNKTDVHGSEITGEKYVPSDAELKTFFQRCADFQRCAEDTAAQKSNSRRKRFRSEAWWQNLIASCFCGSMTAKLRQALKTTVLKRYNLKARCGFRLAKTRIAKVAQGMPVSRPFARKGETVALDTHVVLLCDTSSSMSNSLSCEGLCRTLAILASAFSRVKTDRLKLSVYSFADAVVRLKSPEQIFTAGILSRLPPMIGGTDGWRALRSAADELSRSRSSRKVIICLTDGEWSIYDSFSIAFLRKAGIETYGIGYGMDERYFTRYSSNSVPQFDTWLSVTDLSDLPKLMTELFTELVRQSQEKA